MCLQPLYTEIIDASFPIAHYIQRSFAKIISEMQEFETSGSGWKLESVDALYLGELYIVRWVGESTFLYQRK